MKNIGIVTFHNAHNYGAMLQVYALQKFLQGQKSKVEVINYENKRIISTYKVFKPIRKNLLKYSSTLFDDVINYKINVKRYNKFNSFMNEELILSEKVKDKEDINSKLNYFDICITGSDQVWNPDIVGELSDIYTLNFGPKSMKRISYAASIGDVSTIEKNKDSFKNKISKIDNISVRETDAQVELSKLLDKHIKVVLDPTLLLTKNEWDDRLKNITNEKEKYILAYMVKADEEYFKIVNELSRKTGLKVVHFEKDNQNYDSVLRTAYTDGPFEFVNLIKNAEYVVATSFHATVFSIIFNRKFFIVPHKKTGFRVVNLLNKLGIENRVFYELKEFKEINYDFETDWFKVEKNIINERNKSIEFLKKAIGN